jgi:ABC-type multidrug transport system fused ATPase/permease subunit
MALNHTAGEIAIARASSGDARSRHDVGRPLAAAALVLRLSGKKIAALFLATIPNGLALGAVEVALAFIFYLVLARLHLVPNSLATTWLPASVDPVVALVVAAVLMVALRYVAQVLPSLAQLAFEARIRQAIVDVALNRSEEGAILSVAAVSHLAGPVVGKAGGFLLGVAQSIGTVCLVMLVGAQLLYLSWQLTAFALIGAVVLGLPVLSLRPIAGRYSDRAYLIHHAFSHTLLKDVRNAHFLKVCGLHRSEVAQLDRLVQFSFGCSRSYLMLSAIGANLPALIGMILILGLLALNERFDVMPLAGLVPFVYLLNRAIGSLVSLSASMGLLREYSPYLLELCQHTDVLFPHTGTATQGGVAAPELSALDVSELEFGRGTALTPPLSLSVRSGEVALVTGPSGRGKTTLLLTLLGLIRPLSGHVTWNGVPLETIDAVDLRRKISFAGPEPYLIDADIRTNLLFGLDRTDVDQAEIEHALHIACADFVFDLKDGTAHQLRENGDGISAGQKQRLALARCLLRRPDALFLDEATANIDEETERKLFERLLAAYPDLLIVAVSHRSSLRNFATRVLEIG